MIFKILKSIRVTAFVAVLLLPSLLSSCDKKNNSNANPVADTVLTSQRLQGKWEVNSIKFYNFIEDTLRNSYFFIKDVGGVRDGRPDGSEVWLEGIYNTYITFDNQNFTHTNFEGTEEGFMLTSVLPKEGSWSLKNEDSLELSSLGLLYQQLRQTAWVVVAFNGSTLVLYTSDSTMEFGRMREEACYLELVR